MTNFFILAGGFGKRAEPLTKILPKPLFPFCGEPLIKIISRQLLKNGIREGFINTHHLSEKIKNCLIPGLDVSYIYENTLSGSRIISRGQSGSGDNLFVINGDTFLNIPFARMLKLLKDSKADGVLLVREKDDLYSSIISNGDDFVRRDKNPKSSGLMFTGISLFRKEFLSEILDENLFDSLETSEGRIKILKYDGIWLDIGTPENYFNSEREYRKYSGRTTGNSISENVTIGDNVKIINSIIWNNSTIEGNGTIRDSIISGFIDIKNKEYRKKIIIPEGVYNLSE